MKNPVKTLLQFLIKRDIFLALFLIISSAFLISKVPALTIRADNEVLLNKNSSSYSDYTRFLESFSSDRILITLFEGDIFTANNLKTIDLFSKKAENIHGINEVISLTNAQGFEKTLFAIKTFPIYEKWKEEEKDIAWLKEAVNSNHFVTQNLLSNDQSAAIVLIFLNDDVKEELRNKIVSQMQDLLKESQSESLKSTLAGVPLEEYLFLNNIKADQKILVPWIFIFLSIMCLIFLRGRAAIISALGSILLTILWIQGTVVWFDRHINPITSLLSPVVMVISLAHIVHIFNHLSHHRNITRQNVNEVIFDVIAQVGLPSFLAALTTSIGFLSLSMSDNPAVKEFGVFASLASCYSFLISFAVSIIMVKKVGVNDRKIDIYLPKQFLQNLCKILKNFKTVIFIIGIIICIYVIKGIFHLDADTKLLNYLKNKNQIMYTVNVIDEKFNGSNNLEVVLSLKQGTFFDYENFIALHQLTENIKTIPRIKNTNSFDDLILNIHQILEGADDKPIPNAKRLELFHEKLQEKEDEKLYKFISKDFKTVRINCLLLNSSTGEILDVKQAIDKKIRSIDLPNSSAYVTGRDFLFSNMSQTLVKGQIRTMLWAGIPISLMVFLSLMSFRFGIAGILAMGLPIAMTYGVMGYQHISLNTATIMISSVAMGLLVDDTIHFLYRFKQELKKPNATPVQCVEETVKVTGKAIIITSLILIGGFSIGVIGSVIPTVHFSILMGLAAFLSLLINIIFLPTMLLVFTELFGTKKLIKREGQIQ